ncbi:glucosaminidase domain-containing protein [Treponema parvum]|uniref:Glucosaminidase domain-containing protein n=1 Tax=Treponema parvum TaxID=138851 RepID=A0A975EYP1_9SPIR|nr:glucosaminidase domain-containing protein [Treponema parvum]QTQ11256.1 glucosaminidase domain-containing protein [Treponema parvum]QTQ16810.1 glucosaminidase domain-containing protein [Treponema parvum]
MKIHKLIFAVQFICLGLFFSCRTTVSIDGFERLPSSHKNRHFPQKEISRSIAGRGIKSAEQLTEFFMANRPDGDRNQVKRLAKYYIDEGLTEGINSDVAFVQMCLETGFLRFGNLVTADMHNYCGLGAIDAARPGERFSTEQLGVRAHIQHLHAYGTPSDVRLVNPLIDNRYKWVNPRGKALSVFELSGTWASDPLYGLKLNELLTRLSGY